jgi:hypothetical protein
MHRNVHAALARHSGNLPATGREARSATLRKDLRYDTTNKVAQSMLRDHARSSLPEHGTENVRSASRSTGDA